jgi:uncharacterized protein (TIGR02271 family)
MSRSTPVTKGTVMERVRDYDAWIGYDAFDRHGDKVGGIDQIFYDDATGRPEWVAVRTGWFGTKVTLAPIAGSTVEDTDGLRLAYDKAMIKDAPNFDFDDHLNADEERALYAHYGFSWDDVDGVGYGYGNAYEQERADRDFTTDSTLSDNGDDAMTRSEEELRVGTERRQTGRARLRKYVVTEHQQVTVPVSREEVRIEREPITDENIDAALSGPDITESEHEVVTHEERPVVTKETVPKERVRLTKETVTETEQVGADVRKEQIELDADDVPHGGRR